VSAAWLSHPLLGAHPHGFGTRDCAPPSGLVRARQVHGRDVLRVTRSGDDLLGAADALVCDVPGVPIGVVTADCLPVLIAAPSGAVAAAHAGWRGLAAGVLQAAVDALAHVARDVERAVAVIGPHIGAGCYEVDAPVIRALAARFGDALDEAIAPTRPAHFQLDLARLAALDLANAGLRNDSIATLPDACTACHRERLHSYRRDGPGAGRLVHYIEAIEERTVVSDGS
jgi:YfiH family protein